MKHLLHNNTNASTSSPLTSCSAEASLEIYERNLKPRLDCLIASDISLRGIVHDAKEIVEETFAPDSRSTFTFKELSVKLDNVMLAMLAYAEDCGGESGHRYVASAILACSKVEEEEEKDVVGMLLALGTTWLTHFLFLFKTGRDDALEPKQESFSGDVMARDGYTCVLTGLQDPSHPNPNPHEDSTFYLTCTHILPRAIVDLGHSHNSNPSEFSLASFHILAHLTSLPAETLEELSANFDDLSNGITLQADARRGFDNLHWSMKKTEEENVYALKVFRAVGIMRLPKNNLISFQDHRVGLSSSPSPSPSPQQSQHPKALPNPQYLAIHSAVAQILHTSGAGRFFDELLRKHRDDEGRDPAVRSWLKFEKLMEMQAIRESVIDMFQVQAAKDR